MDTPLILRFVEWQCGHHCQRPHDIGVSTPAQAIQIAWAIAHAISQPGHARAVLMNEDRAETVYITDDHVSVGYSSGDKFPDLNQWAERPVVIVGTEADIDAIHGDDLAEARDEILFAPVIGRLDPLGTLYGNEIVTSYLPQAELEEKARPKEYYEDKHVQFDLPPVFRNAAEVLAELRQEAAEQAAYRAELQKEAAEQAAYLAQIDAEARAGQEGGAP